MNQRDAGIILLGPGFQRTTGAGKWPVFAVRVPAAVLRVFKQAAIDGEVTLQAATAEAMALWVSKMKE